MLEVVEDQQQTAALHEFDDTCLRRLRRPLAELQRLYDRGIETAGISQGHQIHEPGAIGKVRVEARGGRTRQTRFPDPAWTGERQKPDRVVEQVSPNQVQFSVAANEGRRIS
ncbi:MAG TPA: hypothetical protein VGZ23_00725 [bacterium]|nr:hypothetical protein [bacterium]